MYRLIRPNAWVALRLPSDSLKVMQVVPNTTISLGKYGSFPSNLIIERPYHVTFELEDKRPNESFHRLRVVPHTELYADIFAEEAAATAAADGTDDGVPLLADDGMEYSVVDGKGEVLARSSHEIMDDDARQTLSFEEIEDLKREGSAAGKELITKLMLRHTALDLKTSFSLSKYKLLKTRKYIRRFTVLPYDPTLMGTYLLEDKDAGSKTMEMREEMVALVGCWANVHYGGDEDIEPPPVDPHYDAVIQTKWRNGEKDTLLESGRWLVVDDTGGLLVAALAEKMGILHPSEKEDAVKPSPSQQPESNGRPKSDTNNDEASKDMQVDGSTQSYIKGEEQEDGTLAGIKMEVDEQPDIPGIPVSSSDVQRDAQTGDKSAVTLAGTEEKEKPDGAIKLPAKPLRPRRDKRGHDFHVPFSRSNTITMIHTNSQPNLTYLRQYGYDSTNPNHPPHPLFPHLLTLTWLQLLAPESDTVYSAPPPCATPEEVMSWKANRRGNYHRKRRRWVRTHHIVDSTRGGNFSGLVVSTTMDPVSVLRHTLPLLAGGAPVAVYSPTLEPLTRLADCFSVARRGAWMAAAPDPDQGDDGNDDGPEPMDATDSATDPAGRTSSTPSGDATPSSARPRMVRREGTDEFPVNPSLLLGVSIQTSRVRKWQVLPNRTHPVMTSRGGSEGYVLTGWRAVPLEGHVEARGKFMKRQKRGD